MSDQTKKSKKKKAPPEETQEAEETAPASEIDLTKDPQVSFLTGATAKETPTSREAALEGKLADLAKSQTEMLAGISSLLKPLLDSKEKVAEAKSGDLHLYFHVNLVDGDEKVLFSANDNATLPGALLHKDGAEAGRKVEQQIRLAVLDPIITMLQENSNKSALDGDLDTPAPAMIEVGSNPVDNPPPRLDHKDSLAESVQEAVDQKDEQS